ncbi:DUF6308 family protein [Rhodococcus wratislaviensis]|uniref:DUF6308 family protein n=1 Tax=Rhodococcus wratislaviensis TaxID=44752 RepID=UPI00351151C6
MPPPGDGAAALSALLAAIGPGRDWGLDGPDPLGPGGPSGTWKRPCGRCRGSAGMKATKLIARKRPRLFPIFGCGGQCRPRC